MYQWYRLEMCAAEVLVLAMLVFWDFYKVVNFDSKKYCEQKLFANLSDIYGL